MARTDKPRSGRSFLERFGATILRGGIAPVPATLYFYQAELALSPQEVWFIGYILAHKWDEDLPHPSLVKMAERVGISVRQLHRIKDGLVAKGLLELVPRRNVVGGKDPNGYDFTPLFGRLEELITHGGSRGERPVAVPDPGSEGDVTSTTYGDVTLASHRDVTSTTYRDVTSPSQTHVTPESYTYVTPESHDSEADHAEPDHAEPPPPPARHIPLATTTPTVVVAVAVPSRFEQDVRLLVERLEMDEETARECAQLVRVHRRPEGYVAELVEHALADPEVRDPLKVVISNIRRNERRVPTTGARSRRQPPPASLHLVIAPAEEQAAEEGGDRDAETDLTPIDETPLPDESPLWQATLATLRFALPADDYYTVVQYVQLREVDRERGWALLSAPNHHVCRAVQTRLREPIVAALRLAVHLALQVRVVIPSVQGTPTLAELLAADAAGPLCSPATTSASVPNDVEATPGAPLDPQEA